MEKEVCKWNEMLLNQQTSAGIVRRCIKQYVDSNSVVPVSDLYEDSDMGGLGLPFNTIDRVVRETLKENKDMRKEKIFGKTYIGMPDAMNHLENSINDMLEREIRVQCM